jgi:hypothetical protein
MTISKIFKGAHNVEGMEIFGRSVDAVRYLNGPLVNVYVRQKPGDCNNEKFQCEANCGDDYVVVRFLNKQPISIKGLVTYDRKCGFALDRGFEGDVSETVRAVLKSVDEIYSAAKVRPLDALLEDHSFAKQLENPKFLSAVSSMFGAEGTDFVRMMKSRIRH